MRKNILVVVSIVMLFVLVFIVSNRHYFFYENKNIIENGIVTLSEEQLKGTTKLVGEWLFYPNEFIEPEESLENNKYQPIIVTAPGSLTNVMQPDKEGLVYGTYYVKVKVPTDGQYGLYINTIRRANRVFINAVEVGGKGHPARTLNDHRSENADKYTVLSHSNNKELHIVIHIGGYHNFQHGMIHPIEFGTAGKVQELYLKKLLLNAFVSSGHIILGMIYCFSYLQNHRRKEELFFGLFTILTGIYMSFINEKIFFLLVPIELIAFQTSLQLGIIPLCLICLTGFIYYMYPHFMKKQLLYLSLLLLVIVIFLFGIYFPLYGKLTASLEESNFRKLFYIALIAPTFLNYVTVLIRVLLRRLEEAKYVLIVVTSVGSYGVLLSLNFIADIPFDYSEFTLFLVMLIGFSLLLNYRANASLMKVENLTGELVMHNNMKDEFLVKTSHELRTPLNGILNLSKSLMEGLQGPLKREQHEQVILIHNVTKRLGHLVEDLLFSSHHMTGEVKITPTVVSVNVITEVVKEIQSMMLSNPHVQIIVNIDSMMPHMWTDELRFKQVLYNLLHNAIRHTQEGEITVTAFVQQQQIIVQVKDTGAGIAEQDIEHIFTAFYRVAKQSNTEGLGLGLSIAKNIVQKLDGEIYVESKLGQGSTFTFTMPLAKEKQPLQSTSISVDYVPKKLALELPLIHKGNSKTILIVDDDHTNIKVMFDACVARGYSVVAVDNGFDALQYISKNEVDCLLTDLLMDEMSGYELCKQVRKHYDMLELPIIVLTAIMKQTDLLLTLQVGANDYLQKPIAIDELFIRIESLLAIRQTSIDAIEAEMNYLYTQVTPHFVYNTLNTIIGLSYTNIENMREALYCLATYFRAKLNVHYRNSMVSLEEEIELVKAYLYIEKMRFGDRLTVRYDIDESIQLMIPALSLQPLIENAVVHGISKKKEGGTIEVSVQYDGQFIRIKVADNGAGMADEKLQQLLNGKSTRIGFVNPWKKFNLLKNVSVHLNSEPGRGTTVIILLPREEGV
ncbi:ATP-binding protein [Metasolibacillus meyeri]|uniref:histidine kinase n=1 Tax=Metasolibacillus meyeri TaxID=1071052 RepID=A0AAW9NUS6_9BACL|nr:ATP-binding protein [Metasolibacillus meyeri]MEC1178013.1 ATP-binding protein [Metasolibacillus meyeri]